MKNALVTVTFEKETVKRNLIVIDLILIDHTEYLLCRDTYNNVFRIHPNNIISMRLAEKQNLLETAIEVLEIADSILPDLINSIKEFINDEYDKKH